MAPAVELSQLTKRYGPTVGVEDLDLTVEAGEVFGFLGPNGAGKTTTIRCIVGLLGASAGAIRVFGLDPFADHRRVAPRLGYLPGELRLYPELTGAQHLELLSDLQRAPTPRRDECCERLALTSTDLAKPVGAYSHGMKQKLGIVQAFQHDPELLVLDEPTEGLDPLVQDTFFTLIAETADAGHTVFLSSHVLPDVQRACNRVGIIRAGRLVTVEQVETLRGARLRRVRLRFEPHVEPARVPVEDAWTPRWSDRDLHLLVEPAEVVAVLRRMLTLPVADVTVEEASLDEAFLELYRTADVEASA